MTETEPITYYRDRQCVVFVCPPSIPLRLGDTVFPPIRWVVSGEMFQAIRQQNPAVVFVERLKGSDEPSVPNFVERPKEPDELTVFNRPSSGLATGIAVHRFRRVMFAVLVAMFLALLLWRR